MDRMKTFWIYALCIALFFIFSNIMIDIALKASYSAIDTYSIVTDDIHIGINKSRATFVNGYVGGVVTNKGEYIERAYIKIDLYSKRDVLLGTKYVEVNNLRQSESINFEMGFRFTDVDHASIELVSNIDETVKKESFISEELAGIRLLATVFMLCLL